MLLNAKCKGTKTYQAAANPLPINFFLLRNTWQRQPGGILSGTPCGFYVVPSQINFNILTNDVYFVDEASVT